jgi:hypothetical protein
MSANEQEPKPREEPITEQLHPIAPSLDIKTATPLAADDHSRFPEPPPNRATANAVAVPERSVESRIAREGRRWEGLTAWSTLALAVATFALAIFTLRLWLSTQELMKATADGFHDDSVDRMRPVLVLGTRDDPVTVSNLTTLVMKNVGVGAALNASSSVRGNTLRLDHRGAVAAGEVVEVWAFWKGAPLMTAAPTFLPNGTRAPSGSAGPTKRLTEVDANLKSKIESLEMCVAYQDIRGSAYETWQVVSVSNDDLRIDYKCQRPVPSGEHGCGAAVDIETICRQVAEGPSTARR